MPGAGIPAVPGSLGGTALYNRVDAGRAERIVSEHVVDGQIVRVFDPLLHHEAADSYARRDDDSEPIDRRWVRIQRPTIVVGGELTLDSLELARNPSSKTLEARDVPGLYVIGEAVDVTGWLGGYNFQWAWASGVAAGEVA